MPLITVNRGVNLCSTRQHQRAIEDYNNAIRLNGDYALLLQQGEFYRELGQYQQAIADYNEAIHLKPNYVQAYNNRGILICIKATTTLAAMTHKRRVN